MHDINLNENILKKQEKLAEQVRSKLAENKIKAFNVMGAIGSGKTSLIENIVKKKEKVNFGAIAGDVAGNEDYKRFKNLHIPAANLNTKSECHLDAHLVEHALAHLPLDKIEVLFIENVGNLVCPADFPLGTDQDIVVISVTEGEDMIRKHPQIFAQSDLTLVNKIDLAEIIGVEPDKIVNDFRNINPGGTIVLTDCGSGRGIKTVIKHLGIGQSLASKL